MNDCIEIIETIERDCPICDKVHVVEKCKHISRGVIHGKYFSFEEVYFRCPVTNGEFIPAGLMDENLSRARVAYNKSIE